jgi:hypothetical protein
MKEGQPETAAERVERFRADKHPDWNSREPRTRGSPLKRSYARVPRDYFPAIGRVFDPAVVLLLELVRQEGLNVVQKNNGWMVLKDQALTDIGLSDKRVRQRAVQRLTAAGFIGTRRQGQARLQYRLMPDWWKSKVGCFGSSHAKR